MESLSPAKSKLTRQHEMLSSAETEQKKKIIDLNDDCLMKVFGYLDFQCLLNVAVANKWLRPAARDVYTRKFVRKSVKISGCEDQSKAYVLAEYKWCNQIEIIGLKLSLLYLRCFGPAITDLCIDYNRSESKRYQHVHQYINDYCAATLTRIRFVRMPNIEIEQFQKVFARVEDVVIFESVLGVQWSHTFADCFPNLRHLQIEDVDIEHGVKIKKSFQCLEHLEIIGCNEDITKQLATDLMQGVQRLKNLEIKHITEGDPNCPIAVLLNMIKSHTQITKLAYTLRPFRHIMMNSVDVQRIIAEHSALIELQLEDYRFTVEDVFTMIRQLHSLEHFKFQVSGLEYATLEAQLDDTKWKISGYHRFNYYPDLGEQVCVTLFRINVE